MYRTEEEPRAQLAWFDRNGQEVGVIVRSGVFGNPVLSPDGKRIVVDLFEGGNQDIWTIDVSTGQLNRITFDAAIDHFPIWSPDGHRIAFESHRGGGGYTLYVK